MRRCQRPRRRGARQWHKARRDLMQHFCCVRRHYPSQSGEPPMFLRHTLSCSVVTVLFLMSAVAGYADKSHDGKVVSVSDASGSSPGKLVMTDKEGNGEHSHAI